MIIIFPNSDFSFGLGMNEINSKIFYDINNNIKNNLIYEINKHKYKEILKYLFDDYFNYNCKIKKKLLIEKVSYMYKIQEKTGFIYE